MSGRSCDTYPSTRPMKSGVLPITWDPATRTKMGRCDAATLCNCIGVAEKTSGSSSVRSQGPKDDGACSGSPTEVNVLAKDPLVKDEDGLVESVGLPRLLEDVPRRGAGSS